MAEVFARGPVACGVDATPLLDYAGGIINDTTDQSTDHIVSITGWGYDSATSTKYWIVRNSWGPKWGEDGFFRLCMDGTGSKSQPYGICQLNRFPTYPTMEPHPVEAEILFSE